MMKFPKLQQNFVSSGESGFTIVESLVAILVAAALLTAIAPVLVFSTATRVQARRIELASRAAKTFIDGVRTGAITTLPTAITPTLAAPTATAPRSVATTPGDYLINTTNMPVPTASTGLYCYNQNDTILPPNCTSNLLYIQARRLVQSTGATDGYRLAIRIYRADVNFNQALQASTGTTARKQNVYAAGMGSRQAPLLEMTTDIAATTTTFQSLCQRLGTATNQTCQ